MTREEQDVFLSKEYFEAIRYMDNAKDFLRKAEKDGALYTDEKYIRVACATAYSGVLLALDAWFVLKEIPKPSKNQRKSIEYYMSNIAKIDKKMASFMHIAYDILHLDGYYDGIKGVKAIESGFDAAYEIIEKIKPENPVEIKESRADSLKRMFDKLQILIAVIFVR
ncbi:MAG: DUF5618 family protein [Chitinivibrionia bacterium]|nr:DUF5618 family protein [Chitinivibrionia bacterium]